MTGWAWALLALYGIGLWIVSPRATTAGAFFRGTGPGEREVGAALLAGSVLVTWIFAKSITNAANLGAAYGLPGGVAYAGWYASIPVAAWVIGSICRTTGAASLAGFLVARFGRAAALAFMVAIAIRLYNEVWSNTVVVGTYFGEKGSAGFFLAAAAFTAFTLAYSVKGGLRSSIVTDAIQLALLVFLLALVALAVVPARGVAALAGSGSWTLAGGVDLLLVALLQSVSYPFHDPVLTDRAFIAPVSTVRRAFGWAGAAGAALIVVFSAIGIHAYLGGLEVLEDAPRVVAAAFGVSVLAAMNLVMMSSAGSTLDSTFAALAKWTAVDLPVARGGEPGDPERAVRRGRIAMVVGALLGSLPLLGGATILQATTISGTMVIGLAPPIVLHRLGSAPPAAFHVSFWSGIGIGVVVLLGAWPGALSIGDGAYAGLLGANLFGLVLVTAIYVGVWRWDRPRAALRRGRAAVGRPGGS